MVPNASLSGGVGAANSDRSDAQLSTPEPAFVRTPKAQRSILQNFTAKTKASPPLTNCEIHGSTVLDDFRTDPRYSQWNLPAPSVVESDKRRPLPGNTRSA